MCNCTGRKVFEMEDKFVYETSTGIKLYTNGLTENTDKYAKNLGLKQIKVYKAVFDGKPMYVIFQGKEAVYETTSYEQVGCRLDALKIIQGR
jgi:hypothetical protein